MFQRFLVICGVSLAWAGGGQIGAAPLGSTSHWAFQPMDQPAPGSPAGRSMIDALVQAKWGGSELAPAADRRVLIRRLSFDLRGLPPTPAEVAAFVDDHRADAWERLIEQFLSSPQYGERWGRHWLDLAAYADSNGYFNADTDRPLAWKYRDYVVRSIQRDKPFDRFIQEQIAGDELVGFVRDGDLMPEMIEPLIATQFLRNAPDGSGESDGNPLEVKVDRYSVMEGTVQLIGNAFLGLTLQCARCHDHKFEPITQNDYYALQAILRPAYNPDSWLKPNERAVGIGTRSEREARAEAIQQHENALKSLRTSLEDYATPYRRRLLVEKLAAWDDSSRQTLLHAFDTKEKERTDAMKALLKTHATLIEIKNDALMARYKDFGIVSENLKAVIQRREAERPLPLEQIAILAEPNQPPPSHHLLVRGNHATEGEEVPPAVPVALTLKMSLPKDGPRFASVPNQDNGHASNSGSAKTSGRRLALARWLTAPDNPLVARVLVNRIWSFHFGQGLVSSLDNLGQSGAKPTHPELLNRLAWEFIRSGWSLKHLHRVILTSAAWKQTGENGLTPNLRRLDAESLRDALLAVSGELELQTGGPYTPIKVDDDGQIIIDEATPGARRRSVYLQQRRTQPVALLQVFDGAAHNPVCVQRVESTVALQSLSQLNSDFVRVRSRHFARRILGDHDLTLDSPVAGELMAKKTTSALIAAFELAWCRPPADAELSAAQSFIHTQAVQYADRPDATERIWTDFCQMLLVSNPFLYVE